MSMEQVSVGELLLSLDSTDLQEAEQGREAISQQLNSDRGGAVLCSLVDCCLNSSSSCELILTLLSSIREPLHKALLDKLNEAVSRPVSRLAAVTLLGHMISQQPAWIHHVSRSPLLATLLRCLKSDSDVKLLVPGVLVIVMLLPMIPQAAKQHIYDFFDVFGRLASWSLKKPGHTPTVHVVHLHAGVYSLFHRLYGMFPCNFLSYLRLHFSMKENLDTFQHVVKVRDTTGDCRREVETTVDVCPMLDQVRVHPELVSGTQDSEVDPSRWRHYEVHDIIMECSRVSLDPLESCCDDHMPAHLDHTCPHGASRSKEGEWTHTSCLSGSALDIDHLDVQLDVTWSPSSECGLSTPPPEMAALSPAHPLSRNSISGVKYGTSPAVAPPIEESADGVQHAYVSQVRHQPIRKEEVEPMQDDVVTVEDKPLPPQPSSSLSSSPPALVLLTSTPTRYQIPPVSDLTPPSPPCSGSPSPAPSYDFLFEHALPRAAAMLFVKRKTQEVQRKMAAHEKQNEDDDEEEDEQQAAASSSLHLLERLIAHGNDTHASISSRSLASGKSVDRNPGGGIQQSVKSKGCVQGEDAEALRCGLRLAQAQLQYERFKRQQHGIRNRRLLRRVISAAALEEQSVAMRAQLAVRDEETRALTRSLEAERRRSAQLQRDAHAQQLHAHVHQLLRQRRQHDKQHLAVQSELQECQGRLSNLEAELQKANHKAYNMEHQLSQLLFKLASSEKLQHQMFLLQQHCILLRETNKSLMQRLDLQQQRCSTEASVPRGAAELSARGAEAEQRHRRKLDAANHRAAELVKQVAHKEALVEQLKKLLDEHKRRSRGELSACEARCTALRKTVQTLQSEMLHLYGTMDALSRPAADEPDLRPSSSSAEEIVNGGGASRPSASPLLLAAASSSPVESPLAVGSFLERRAWRLFRPPDRNPEETEWREKDPDDEELKEDEVRAGSLSEDAALLAGSARTRTCVSSRPTPAGDPDPSLAVRQRRRELSIMDYDDTTPRA
ncbi:TSC complex subunit 1a isoform X2 [Phycodurus eques]|uniref:TSC complex subunit 1a isoform X2 n=1 Tax=Phycodurus eques TaxID=693459 RepID=UPI002ACD70E5|nr:TSC complex subunit 1a isoform X2 [Phycodurus eques]